MWGDGCWGPGYWGPGYWGSVSGVPRPDICITMREFPDPAVVLLERDTINIIMVEPEC